MLIILLEIITTSQQTDTKSLKSEKKEQIQTVSEGVNTSIQEIAKEEHKIHTDLIDQQGLNKTTELNTFYQTVVFDPNL